MLDDLQFAPLLDGWRGGAVLDRDAFAQIAVTVVAYLAEHPEIGDIKINPLRLTRTGLRRKRQRPPRQRAKPASQPTLALAAASKPIGWSFTVPSTMASIP